MRTKLFLTGFALIAFIAIAAGQSNNGKNQERGRQSQSSVFVDLNGNGICDRFESRRTTQAGRGKGSDRGRNYCGNACPARQGRNKKGPDFKDSNNNGICDYRERPVSK